MESTDKKVRYVCAECGCPDVYLNAWVDPNNENKFVRKVDDDPDGLCHCCGDAARLKEVDKFTYESLEAEEKTPHHGK